MPRVHAGTKRRLRSISEATSSALGNEPGPSDLYRNLLAVGELSNELAPSFDGLMHPILRDLALVVDANVDGDWCPPSSADHKPKLKNFLHCPVVFCVLLVARVIVQLEMVFLTPFPEKKVKHGRTIFTLAEKYYLSANPGHFLELGGSFTLRRRKMFLMCRKNFGSTVLRVLSGIVMGNLCLTI